MSFLDHIRILNRHDMTGFRPLFVCGREVGWVRHAIAERLAREDGPFEVGAFGVSLRSGLDTPERRTEAVARALAMLAHDGVIPPARGERQAVRDGWGSPPLFAVDRAHMPVLGLRAYGVHLNGYVRKADGFHLWIGRRADDRVVAPGALDNLVAGGVPADLGPTDTLIKECAEEAAIDATLARQARPAGLVSYCMEVEAGLKPDTLFVYDLDVPETFTPRNTDGEIAEFMLWPARTALETVRDGTAFKFNVPLVILDFAIRHGLVTPETDPDYVSLVLGLRRDPVRFHMVPGIGADGRVADSALGFPG